MNLKLLIANILLKKLAKVLGDIEVEVVRADLVVGVFQIFLNIVQANQNQAVEGGEEKAAVEIELAGQVGKVGGKKDGERVEEYLAVGA